ncbi:hypothetical protein HS088_TW02G00953 [Tripterygium wilfordii]|uniref:Regulator of Vps4 activity in the MVB pathway protein n=1 Tax=Tripterygium wilfordii TaxID=458696 RepID=A0A7J7E0G9_TRIWF|nr:uncharacterized protein LOC120012800 [Tripterygium wilfordii]KAF5751934.1 hypothetical protein HS088_TW02G00953 [Tripterygium wilfordii]
MQTRLIANCALLSHTSLSLFGDFIAPASVVDLPTEEEWAMGKKLDALLGRSTFKPYKFNALVTLALSRLAVLKNQRQVRYNQARSDVIKLLEISHHERALLRVEQLIKEQNMLDVYTMMESYCSLLIERLSLIEQERVCPDELKEAIASLLYASSRCGDFPELQEIRAVFTTRYGKEFVTNAIELRNNCRVNPKMIQKLSTRQPGLENRMMLLKEIASEKRITLQFEEASSVSTKEKLGENNNQNQPDQYKSTNSGSSKLGDDLQNLPEAILNDGFSDSMKTRKKYRDVADAAQAAFKSAAYAAEAARAAVELSRTDNNSDDQNSPNIRRRNASDGDEAFGVESNEENGVIQNENQAGQKEDKTAAVVKRSMSASSSDSAQENVTETITSPEVDVVAKLLEKEIVFDESDDEVQHTKNSSSAKENPTSIRAVQMVESGAGQHWSHGTEYPGAMNTQPLNKEKRPFSLRTRKTPRN